MAIVTIIDSIFIVLTVTSHMTYAPASPASTHFCMSCEQFQGRRPIVELRGPV